MRSLIGVIPALLIMLVPVAAQQQEAMPPLLMPLPNPFNLERDGNAPHLRMAAEKVRGRTRLYMWGEILAGDSERVRTVIEASKPIDEIRLVASPGGNMDEGMQIGRIIHAYKLFTHIDADGICVSACNFVFLGGVIRQIDLGGTFRVHMWALTSAPLVLLNDVITAEKETTPPPANPPSPANPTPTVMAPVDTVALGKLVPPHGLKSLGCDFQHLYSETYDEKLQRMVMQAETGKEPGPNEPIAIKSQALLAEVRALAMDALCLEEKTAQAAASVAQFIIEMRLSLDFLTDFSTIAHPLPVNFTRDQLHRYNIINTE